jgi:phospholipase D-like protein
MKHFSFLILFFTALLGFSPLQAGKDKEEVCLSSSSSSSSKEAEGKRKRLDNSLAKENPKKLHKKRKIDSSIAATNGLGSAGASSQQPITDFFLPKEIPSPSKRLSKGYPGNSSETHPAIFLGSEQPVQQEWELTNKLLPTVSSVTSHDAHIDVLEQACLQAKKTILITNFGNLQPNLLKTPLFRDILPIKSQEGVRIYYRFMRGNSDKYPPIPLVVKNYFEEYGIDYAEFDLHIKAIVIDHNAMILGSFNWLTDSTYPESYNRSLMVQGNLYDLIENFWDITKYHRNKSFPYLANKKASRRLRRSFGYYEPFSIETQSGDLTYLSLVEHHRHELLYAFKTAQHSIVILSPFIAYNSVESYKSDFVRELLNNAEERNLKVCFVVNPTIIRDPNVARYRINQFNKLVSKYSNIALLEDSSFHAKSIFVDDNYVLEGSFNWLSAVRREDYKDYKQEGSFVYEGEGAKGIVSNFYQSSVGKEVTKKFNILDLNMIQRSPPLEEQTDLLFEELHYIFAREDWAHHPGWAFFPFWDGVDRWTNTIGDISISLFSSLEGWFMKVKDQNKMIDGIYIEGDYDRNQDGSIRYYSSQEEAKEASYDFM